ncbi:MAG: Thiol-disulfide oxidoreductase ResA [Candidatus Hydrogenedentes bacterium ADurb.Bin101]|nr:MAG: Thiol-disulfide oxidoreductase ResA [Candidatus Hydrogenedentes bacterium ADurb.Bin101]HOC68015.1 redoxin domain-containing protein [Candidatus Hydrogenedentota bacterium]
MRRNVMIAVFILVVIAATLGAYYFFLRPAPPSAVAPKEPGTIPPVEVQTPPEPKEEGEGGEAVTEVPEGKALLEKMVSAVGSGEPLTFDFTTTINVLNQGQPQNSLVEGKVTLGKGNLGSLQLKNEQTEVHLYSNSDSCITYLPRENQYITAPAADSRRKLVATMMTGILELPAGWLANLLEGKKTDPENWAVSSSEHAGAACWELHADTPEFLLKMILSKEEPHTPLLYAMDLKEAAMNKYRIPPGISLTITMEFSNWQLWYVLPENIFEFTPPEGATEFKPGPEMSGAPLKEGSPAPDFTLEKLGGGTVQLKDHIGKGIIILDFWATWCGPCRRVIPLVSEVAKQFADRGVVLFTVNQREAPEKISAFLESQNLSVPVLLDSSGDAGAIYQVTGIPKVVIIGKDGLIKEIYGGMAPNMKDLMVERIQSLL